jgi:hypothetical protein
LLLVEEESRGGGNPSQQRGNGRYPTVNAVLVFETFTANREMEDEVVCPCLSF